MDRKRLIGRIKAANRSWAERVRGELHDFQYDSDADIMYIAWGKLGESFSIPLDVEGDEIYLRVDEGSFRIVGADILSFRHGFLSRHQDAHEAFGPLLQILGDADWRIQMRLPAKEFTLFRPASYNSVEYFPSYIPRVAPELVHA